MITMNGIFGNTNTCTNLEENELVKNARDDLNQFEPLFNCYFDRVFRYIFSRTNDRQVAEDLTSQIFLKILEALPDIKSAGHLLLGFLPLPKIRLILITVIIFTIQSKA